MSPSEEKTLTQLSHFSEIYRFLPWIVCFSAALFFFYEFVQMNMFNAISADLLRTFKINSKQGADLSTIYFYANIIFLFPAGILLDRYSTKKIILTAMTICVLGTLAFAMAPTFWFALACRFLIGIGSAFCFLSCMRLASRWFPRERMALITGLIVTAAMLGGLLAQTPLALLIEALGWRYALMLDGVLGIFIIFLISMLVIDMPIEMTTLQTPSLLSLDFWRGIKACYFKLQNWLAATYTCLLNMPLGILGVVWGIPFLMQVHHLTFRQASIVTSMLFLGTIIGGPFIGWLSDHLKARKFLMIVGALSSMTIILLLLSLTTPTFWQLFACFLLIGFCTSTQILSYPLVTESNSIAFTATAISVISFLTQGGIMLFESWFSSIIEIHWNGTYAYNLPLYPAEAYEHAFLMIPLGFIIALIAAILIKETHCDSTSR